MTIDLVSYPAMHKTPAKLHDQEDKSAGNNSLPRIRTAQPTIQNYFITTISHIYNTCNIICYTHILIYVLAITPYGLSPEYISRQYEVYGFITEDITSLLESL